MEVRARNSNVMLGGPKNLGGAAALFNFAPDLIQTKTAPVARNFTHHEIIAPCSLFGSGIQTGFLLFITEILSSFVCQSGPRFNTRLDYPLNNPTKYPSDHPTKGLFSP